MCVSSSHQSFIEVKHLSFTNKIFTVVVTDGVAPYISSSPMGGSVAASVSGGGIMDGEDEEAPQMGGEDEETS